MTPEVSWVDSRTAEVSGIRFYVIEDWGWAHIDDPTFTLADAYFNLGLPCRPLL